MKDKQWKDYWDVDLGVSYIPIHKLDPQVNMADLEEGGTFDEDTMPDWMKTMRGVAPSSINQPPGMAPVVPPPQAAAAVAGVTHNMNINYSTGSTQPKNKKHPVRAVPQPAYPVQQQEMSAISSSNGTTCDNRHE